MIVKPTRIQYYKNSLQVKSASLIDQIVTNLFDYECLSGNLQYSDSDHYATFAIFNSYKDECTSATNDVMRRNLNKVDDSKLKDDFNVCYNWDELVFREPNLDIATENLNNCITELKVFFLHICWIYKSGPEKILDKNDVSEKQKTDDFFVRGRGCKSEAVLRK